VSKSISNAPSTVVEAVLEAAYIGVGSNLGDRLAMLNLAIKELASLEQIDIVSVSGVWETSPIGPGEQNDYLNGAALLRTDLPPRGLLDALLAAEQAQGRKRLVRWGPRTLDLDLLLYGDQQVEEPGLSVPHPWLTRRRFVLEPLLEIAPELIHPVTGEHFSECLDLLRNQDQERVQRVVEDQRQDRDMPDTIDLQPRKIDA
jgi:2-amino-4-hydroxy-6-hydroxymethyldihydropteridine diphosphokinase